MCYFVGSFISIIVCCIVCCGLSWCDMAWCSELSCAGLSSLYSHLTSFFISSVQTKELYDHRNEGIGDLGKRETVNLSRKPGHEDVIMRLRQKLVDFLKNNVIYNKP